MLNKYLGKISDPAEYKLALKVVNGEEIGEREKTELLALYEKLYSDLTADARKVCFVMDLAKTPEKLDEAAEGLASGDALSALKDMGELAKLQKVEDEDAMDWVDRALGYEDNVAKSALCRLLLDKLAERLTYAEVGEAIGKLSEFLCACEDTALTDGWVIVMGVKDLWRK